MASKNNVVTDVANVSDDSLECYNYYPSLRSRVTSVTSVTDRKTNRKSVTHSEKSSVTSVTEDGLQKRVHVFLARHLPSRSVHWSTPNEGGGMRAGARRRQMGRRAGIPDLFVLHDGQLIGIELKRPTGAVSISDAQHDTQAALTAAGARCFVCRSIEDVTAALTACGVPLERRKDF